MNALQSFATISDLMHMQLRKEMKMNHLYLRSTVQLTVLLGQECIACFCLADSLAAPAPRLSLPNHARQERQFTLYVSMLSPIFQDGAT